MGVFRKFRLDIAAVARKQKKEKNSHRKAEA